MKLLDYGKQWEALEQNPNPFAIVVMAHLKAQSTRRKSRDRLRWKINLVKALYARGYKRKEVLELLRFIDWIIALAPPKERTFWKEVYKLEEEAKMRYVLSIERIAMQDGIEEGSLKTAREAVLEILELRFHTVPQELIDEINHLNNLQRLKALHREAVTAGTIEEFEQFMETAKPE